MINGEINTWIKTPVETYFLVHILCVTLYVNSVFDLHITSSSDFTECASGTFLYLIHQRYFRQR